MVKLAFRKCQQAVFVIFQQTCYLFMSCSRVISRLVQFIWKRLKMAMSGPEVIAKLSRKAAAGTNSIMCCRLASLSAKASSRVSVPAEHKSQFYFLCYWKWYQNTWKQCDRQGPNFLSNRLQRVPELHQYWKSILEHRATGSLQLPQLLLAIDQQVPSQ